MKQETKNQIYEEYLATRKIFKTKYAESRNINEVIRAYEDYAAKLEYLLFKATM